MAGVVNTTSPISRRRTSRMRCRSVVLGGRRVDEHDRDVIFNRIDALAGRALQRCAVLHDSNRRFTVWTGENLQQLGVYRHARDYMTPLRFCGTIPGMKLAVLAAVFSMTIPLAAEQPR